eukprot:6929300-Prymnesium_polylepis.1
MHAAWACVAARLACECGSTSARPSVRAMKRASRNCSSCNLISLRWCSGLPHGGGLQARVKA